MNYLEKPYQPTDDYDLSYYWYDHSFEMDIEFFEGYHNNFVSLDALQVYKHLKEYFKGTPHE